MQALVTGGGGFLGLYVVEQLLDDGAQVRVFCRSQYNALDRLDVEVVSSHRIKGWCLVAPQPMS